MSRVTGRRHSPTTVAPPVGHRTLRYLPSAAMDGHGTSAAGTECGERWRALGCCGRRTWERWCPSDARPETRRPRAGEARVSRAPPCSPGSGASRTLRRVPGAAVVPTHPVGAATAARGRGARPRCTMGAVVRRGGTRAPGVPRAGAARQRMRAARVARGCRC